jgi:hypothetical protein
MSHTLVVDCSPFGEARVHYDGAFDGTAVVQFTPAVRGSGGLPSGSCTVDAVALRTGALNGVPQTIPVAVFLRVVSKFTEAYCLHTFLVAQEDAEERGRWW